MPKEVGEGGPQLNTGEPSGATSLRRGRGQVGGLRRVGVLSSTPSKRSLPPSQPSLFRDQAVQGAALLEALVCLPLEPLRPIFGGSGFLGRHVVRALAKREYRIRVAVRRPDLIGHLQPLGPVGEIHGVQANLRHGLGGRRARQRRGQFQSRRQRFETLQGCATQRFEHERADTWGIVLPRRSGCP
jgi:hypothetical protein